MISSVLYKEKGFSVVLTFILKKDFYHPRIRIIKNRCTTFKHLGFKLKDITNYQNEDWFIKLTKEYVQYTVTPKKHYEKRFKDILGYAKRRAVKANMFFNLTLNDLLDLWNLSQKCKLTNIPLVLETNHMNSLSIDRIDNSQGYTKLNVQLVCKAINYMKNDSSNIEAIQFIKLIKKN